MNWIRRLLTKNVGLKLLSLALAVALWMAVGSDPITEATFRVPVEFVNVPANLEVLTEQPSVQLWARGPSHSIRQADIGDFTVRLNLGSMNGPGEKTFSLDPEHVATPASLRVVELFPAEIRVTLEQALVKSIPIHPRLSGEPQPGYRVKDVQVTPSEAVIIGPSSHVSPMVESSTDPLDISRLTEDKAFSTSVSISDPLIRFLHPKIVQVTVQLEKTREESTKDSGASRRPRASNLKAVK